MARAAGDVVSQRTADQAQQMYDRAVNNLQTVIRSDEVTPEQRAEAREQLEELVADFNSLDDIRVGGFSRRRKAENKYDNFMEDVRMVDTMVQADFGQVLFGEGNTGTTDVPVYDGSVPIGDIDGVVSADMVMADGELTSEDIKALQGDPDQLLALYENDPASFFDAMEGLDADERRELMTQVQNQMQQTNQMFTMISNLMNAAHSTTAAIARNIRV